MIRETIIKLISQSLGDGFIWKTVGTFLIAVLSIGGFILKHFLDVEDTVEHIQVDQVKLFKNIDIVIHNQELLLKNSNIIADDNSYWQYLTFKNFLYLTLTIGTIVGGVCLIQALFNSQAQITILSSQIDTIKNMLLDISHTNQEMSKDTLDRIVNICKPIAKGVNELKEYSINVNTENTTRLGLPVSNKIVGKAVTAVWGNVED